MSDTGDGDGIIEPGENALLTLVGTMDPHATGFAGSIFDIRGNEAWQQNGVVVRYDNLLDDLTDDGTLHADNSITGIEAFQLPPLFNPDFDASNPVTLYSMEWQPTRFYPYSVSFWDESHLNNDVYVDEFGTSVSYDGVPGSGTFDLPGAATSALLLCAAAMNGRPRRR